MKKQLNVDVIQSELHGGSAFFPGYKGASSPTSPPDEPRKEDQSAPTAHTDTAPADTTRNQPGIPPGVPPAVPLIPKKAKRPIRQRQPFDIYEDQYQILKKIASAEKDFVNGRSMGQMVRDAIDAYLRDHNAS
jgi:hypothetical protein